MGYKADNFEIEEAASGDFTVEATGTVYSKAYDVANFKELIVWHKAAYTSQSGATATVTLQVYIAAASGYLDHATTFTAVNGSDISEIKNFTNFGTRIRMKVVAAGTFGGSEKITFTFGGIGKGMGA